MKSLQWRGWLFVAVVVAGVLAGGCSRTERKEDVAVAEGGYPARRYPAYYVKTNADSVESLMPYARNLARNRASTRGAGLGLLKKGESVALVTNVSADANVMEAIRRALKEQGVTTHILYEHE